MVESTACLLRSYSNPSSSSPEIQQGDPYRCLTSSKSFGRYMTDSLDWQKWSTFTENRYMEDVKKYSKPGSVARMKAYFEAHYKKKAAERAAALLEQTNAVKGSIVGFVAQGSMQMDNHVARGEIHVEEAARNMVSDSVEVSTCTPPSSEERAQEGVQFVEAEENQLVEKVGDVQESGCNQNINGREQVSTQFVKVENAVTSDQVYVCGHFKSIEDNGKGASGEVKKTQRKAIGELGDPTSTGKRKPIFSPFKSRGRIGVPKPPAPPTPSVLIRKNAGDVENRKAATKSFHMSIDVAPKETKAPLSPILQRLVNSRGRIGVPKPPAPPTPSIPPKPSVPIRKNAGDVENRKAATKSLHLSIDVALKETKTPLSPILQKLVNSRGRIGVQKPPAPPTHSVPPKLSVPIRKNAGDVENRRAATKSLHVSIDVDPKETKTPLSPILQRLVNSRGRIGVPKPPAPPTPSVPPKPSVPIQKNAGDVKIRKASTKSLHVSTDVAPKETKTPLSPILQKLVNSRLVKTLAGKAAHSTQGKPLKDTVDIPAHPPVSLKQKKISSLRSPRACTRNVQSPTVSCPFSFKSEERAAKRKEFFESLEQNAKEIGKDKLQENSKVKARNDFKYMHLLSTSKVEPCPDSFRTRRTPSDASKAIPAVSCSPVVSRGETLKDNTNRPPWRLTATCKEVRGKTNQSPAYPLKSVSKKYTSENVSPNIQIC